MTQGPEMIEPHEFRRACGRFATGVTVVTVRDGERVRGMTANSFSAVSVAPPMVLVSVGSKCTTHRLLRAAEHFAVNVLARDQGDRSNRFAGRDGTAHEKFDDVPHQLTEDGLPLLTGAVAHFVCRTVVVHPAGDHSLFVGEVLDFTYSDTTQPLIFYSGAYHDIDDVWLTDPVDRTQLSAAPGNTPASREVLLPEEC